MARITCRILFVAAVLAMIGLPAQAAVRNLYIAASDGYAYLPVDNTVPPFQPTERRYYIRGYCDDVDGTQAVPGCSTFPAPILDVDQGDDVFVQLRNIGNANPYAPPDPHTIHLHGQRFLVLSMNGVPNEHLVWKDTVLLPAGSAVDILLDPSNPGRWMLHCHIAEHLSADMMTRFDVQ